MVERGEKENATRENRHGVQVVVLQTGSVGHFNFTTLLINLVSGLGLLAIGAVICDFVALYVMPDRQLYTRCKVSNTMDFRSLRGDDIAVDIDELEDRVCETNSLDGTGDFGVRAPLLTW